MLNLVKNIKNKQFLSLFVFSLLAVMALPVDAFAETVVTGGNVGGVFKSISGKAADAVKNISQLAYILAGFGMVAFTFGAIFGKISWKHFANIGIGLVMVASSGMIIEYFVTPPGSDGATYRYKLAYGDYISDAVGDTLEDSLAQPSTGGDNGNPIKPSSEREAPLSPLESKGFEGIDNLAPDAGGLAPINGTGIPDAPKKKSLWEKAKEVGQAANDTASVVKSTVKTAAEAKEQAENVAGYVEAAVDAAKSGDFASVGNQLNAALGTAESGLNNIGNTSNEIVGLNNELGDYYQTGEFDKNKYRENDTSLVDAITGNAANKVDNAQDVVDDVDQTADQLDGTIQTMEDANNTYDNYLGN